MNIFSQCVTYFLRAKYFYYDKVKSIFFFCGSYFLYSKKSLPTLRFSLMFSSRIFIVYNLVNLLIHFKLILCMMWVNEQCAFFLWMPSSSICWKLFFLIELSSHYCQKQWNIYICLSLHSQFSSIFHPFANTSLFWLLQMEDSKSGRVNSSTLFQVIYISVYVLELAGQFLYKILLEFSLELLWIYGYVWENWHFNSIETSSADVVYL